MRRGAIRRGGEVLWAQAALADRFWSRARGLLGRNTMTAQEALLIAPCASIHTVGMAFPIDVLFLDSDGMILACHPEVAPLRLLRHPRAHQTVEAQAGSIERLQLQHGQRLTWYSL